MEIKVINNQVEVALRDLKRRMIREGVFKEVSKRKFYLKPSARLKVKREDAEKRRHKERKRMLRF